MTLLRRLHIEGTAAATIIILGSVAFLMPPTLYAPATANAYSVGGTAAAAATTPELTAITSVPTVQSSGLNTMIAPFENFFRSMTSMSGGQGLGPASLPPSVTNNPAINGGVRGALQGFDQWLYGIAGFHILGLFAALLNILAWILGLVTSIVDWLLHLIGY